MKKTIWYSCGFILEPVKICQALENHLNSAFWCFYFREAGLFGDTRVSIKDLGVLPYFLIFVLEGQASYFYQLSIAFFFSILPTAVSGFIIFKSVS